MLSALGLTALVLVPWLIYKLEFTQALLIGANLFAVARFTNNLAALRMLEFHDPL